MSPNTPIKEGKNNHEGLKLTHFQVNFQQPKSIMDCDVFRSCNLISSDIIVMSSIHSIEPHMLLAFMMLRVLVNDAVCLVLAAVTGLYFAAPNISCTLNQM